ncbi:MAG: RagB/SusD family nutrient uptake outer membrane protein [Prevotella sp.]|nr:RagB/SusD family nutrient uptake outer membrane protein [Prevotella sp.]
MAPLASCSDFLDIKSQSEIVLEDFWSEKSDVDNIVAGCYTGLMSDAVVRRMIIWGEGRSENLQVGPRIVDDVNLERILNENITAINPYTSWDGFYSIINRCNTVIKYAPSVAATDPGYTESELRANIAEVSALRDLCYFYLIRTFRDVPYSTEAYIDDDQPMNLPATPFYDVLDSLINDLESIKNDAVAYYPETKPKYQTGRITQTAIHAMLCEMYLWKKDYDNCVRYADLVIDFLKQKYEDKKKQSGRTLSGQTAAEYRVNGYPLEVDMSSSSYGLPYENIFVDGNSQETIFEIFFADETTGGAYNTAVSALYGHQSNQSALMSASETVTEDIDKKAHVIFAERNKEFDARMYEWCDASTGDIRKFVCRSITIMSQNNTVRASEGSKFPEKTNGSKWVIYRLPDIMLLKAEALTQKLREGSDAEVVDYNKPILEQCFNLVNAINKRSILKGTQDLKEDTLLASAYMSKAQMEELVMLERQRELMFEGKRWYDLVRRSLRDGNTDVLTTAAMKRKGINAQYVRSFLKKEDAIFWPYNNEEMKVNKNLVQNPSFGSGENESYEKTK